MRILREFTEFVVEYDSEEEYSNQRDLFVLGGYNVVGEVKTHNGKLEVTYQLHNDTPKDTTI